jgi:hypothetical protein
MPGLAPAPNKRGQPSPLGTTTAFVLIARLFARIRLLRQRGLEQRDKSPVIVGSADVVERLLSPDGCDGMTGGNRFWKPVSFQRPGHIRVDQIQQRPLNYVGARVQPPNRGASARILFAEADDESIRLAEQHRSVSAGIVEAAQCQGCLYVFASVALDVFGKDRRIIGVEIGVAVKDERSRIDELLCQTQCSRSAEQLTE